MSTPPGLGPHCVGQRVVVRRVLRGRTGPSGGPAMTDLLGVMESWTDTATVVRSEDGVATEIALADIVSGKPVPARPSPRHRVSAEEACRMSNASWPAVHTEPLGEWLLRASGGFSARANSVMATGDPGVPLDEALARVREFYARHRLPVWAQVVVGSDTQHRLEEAGWVLARPGEADSELQLASVAQAARAVRRLLPEAPPPVAVLPAVSEGWLANDKRALAHRDDAVAVLEGPAQVGFVEVREGDLVVAKGRVAVEGDWAGITDIWVSPDRRRRGLGLVVVAAMLDFAGERGGTTAYLQVRGDNPAGLGLYDRLGFRTHHTYRYLSLPVG
ncbi:MAG: GNAT family N-acetyltransferase [Nocardioidaceae bacterium]|nr:GNAT family N-acetyltransferase [Nocardioidaceae bacterium]NUS50730.1 GNAT family N-acetyltransferase [Nocardioidaceae bacterium]